MIMSSAANVLTLLTILSIKARSVDPDQSALGLNCLSKRLYKYFSRLLVL